MSLIKIFFRNNDRQERFASQEGRIRDREEVLAGRQPADVWSPHGSRRSDEKSQFRRVASVSPLPSTLSARSSLRTAAIRLADAAQSGTPRSPEASSSEDVSFPFDELGIGEPRSIPLEPKSMQARSLPLQPKSIPLEPRSIPLEPTRSTPLEPRSTPLGQMYPLWSSRSAEPKSIPLERSIGSSVYARAVREAADSPQDRTGPAAPPPVIRSRWTPLIVTPESPPHKAADSPASPDTQTVSPQVRILKYSIPTLRQCCGAGTFLAEAGLKFRLQLQLQLRSSRKIPNTILSLCFNYDIGKLKNKSFEINEFFFTEEGGVLLNNC